MGAEFTVVELLGLDCLWSNSLYNMKMQQQLVLVASERCVLFLSVRDFLIFVELNLTS